jgi:anaerobic selenocysteine-containing dehydrogenase
MEPSKSENQKPKSPISRRGFFKLGGTATAAGATALAARQGIISSPKGSPAEAAGSMEERIVKTTCALCASGCGLDVRVVNGKAVKVEGNPLHPLNQGVCCLKGQASLEMLYSPERIQHPRIQTGQRGSGDWKEISWEEALNIVAKKLRSLREAELPYTVALIHGHTRGQSRAAIKRFMAAYGSPNVISRESLGEQAVRQAMFLTQGVNGLPVYDLNNANYVMSFGGNLLETSRHVIGNLGATAFMRRGRPQRGKLVAAHPRLSLTGIKSDEWVPIRPGTYAALALGMANVIINSQLYDETFVRDFTFGFEDFQDEGGLPHMGFKSLVLENYTLERVSAITGIATETIARLAGEFATNRPAVAIMPTEPGELSSGNSLYTAMAIHSLNALVGSIDAPGGVLVQRYPQPAPWPDYQVDAVARQSLSYKRIDGAGSQEMPLAASAYQKVADGILSDQPYPLNALILINANPIYEAPANGRAVQALLKIPFVVSFASTLDESAAHADLVLPTSTFLEVWEDDYIEGTGFPGISLRRPVVPPAHDSRGAMDALLDLAHRIGKPLSSALPWEDYKSLIEHRLSNVGLDWDKLEENGAWSEMIYFNAAPGSPAWGQVVGRDRLNAPQDGRFDLFSRELFPILGSPTDEGCLPHFELPEMLSEDSPQALAYPFLLTTQSLITQTDNWQGIVPTLQEAYGLQGNVKWSSWVEINPLAAQALNIKDGDLVWVESPVVRLKVPVRLYEGLWPNAVYMPPGQGHHTLVRWGRNSPNSTQIGANPNQLASMESEPLSGQAVSNPTRVKIYKA